jgi:hypothetical protein
VDQPFGRPFLLGPASGRHVLVLHGEATASLVAAWQATRWPQCSTCLVMRLPVTAIIEDLDELSVVRV